MKDSMRKGLICFLLIAALNLSLFSTGSQRVKAAPGQPEWLPVPREESLIFYGGSHQYPYSVFDNFNPLVPAVYSETYHVGLVQAVWEAPWYINYATGERIYWLCTGWEYKDNFTTFIMYLRKGVTYSDGHPFTANDLVTDINVRMKDPKIPGYPFFAEYVEEATATDNYTFVVKLKKPYPRFHYTYQGWGGTGHTALPSHIWDKVEDPISYKYFPPIGTGPYKLYKVYPEQKMYIWVRRDDYWAKDLGYFPAPKYLVFKSSPPPDAILEDFIKGYIDGIQNPPLEIMKSAILRYENTTITPYQDPCPNTILVNTAKYPLNYTEVRWAIAYSIDRNTIAPLWPSLVNPGPALAPWGNWSGPNKYFVPEIFNKYKLEYNLTKAKELLDSLGFIDRDGDGIRETPNGTKLSFTLITLGPPGEFLEMMASHVVSELKKIGIDAEERVLAWGVYFDNIQMGMFDLAACWVCSGINFNNDPHGLIANFWSEYVSPIGERNKGGGWETTSSRFTDPEIDEIVEKTALMDPDDPETQALYLKGIEIIMRELPVIPVSQKIFTCMWSTTYWTHWPTVDDFYAWPALHWGEFLFVILGIRSAHVAPIEYKMVWFTAEVAAFTGADGKKYGPFSKGESAEIPLADAKSLIAKGLASYTPPLPTGLVETITKSIEEAISPVSENVNNLSSAVDKLSGTINALSSLYYSIIGLLIIILILNIVVIAKVAKK